MGNRASAPPSKGGPTPSTNPQVPNPYGSQFQPQRYSNDYFRYQQSGDAFNQPVMGYGTYGQIFTPPPQRFRPQPIMGGKGGMGYRPSPPVPPPGGKGGGMDDMRYRGPQQPPRIGGKGGTGFPKPPRTMGGKGGQEPPQPFPNEMPIDFSAPRAPETQYSVETNFPRLYADQIVNQPTAQTGTYLPTGGASSVALAGLEASPVTSGIGLGEISPRQTTDVGLTNRFAISTADSRYNPETGTFGPSNTVYFDQSPTPSVDFSSFNRPFFFQEGGQVPPDANMEQMLSEAGPADPQAEMAGEYDRLIQMTMQAVLGQVEQPDEIIQMFIDEFGVDAFRQLREAVLKQQVPNAQTEGMVDGNGGGMDDQVMGMIGAQRPVAVSPGEYIIPADVVSGLGDGSSKSGADILDELSQAVRMARTGTPEQPRPLLETLSQ